MNYLKKTIKPKQDFFRAGVVKKQSPLNTLTVEVTEVNPDRPAYKVGDKVHLAPYEVEVK